MPIDDALKKAVGEAADSKVRLCKVSVAGKPPRLTLAETAPASESFSDDFDAMVAGSLLEAAAPCILLIRLADDKGTVPGATADDWVLLSWMPEDAPVRQKMLYTTSCKTLKDCFETLRFKEMKATEKDDLSIKDLLEKARNLSRGMTRDERHAVMTNEEIGLEEVQEDLAKAQQAAPKMLQGLVALQIQPQASFEEAMAKLLAEKDKAVLAKLTGPKREELSGELMDGVAAVSQLRGRLPQEEPCYVVLRPAEQRLLLLTWIPEGIPPRMKMTVSTFKKSVVQILEGKLPGCHVARAELTEESDLVDELAAEPAPAEAAAAEEPGAAAAPSPKRAFKPPVGGFQLPGLGPPRG